MEADRARRLNEGVGCLSGIGILVARIRAQTAKVVLTVEAAAAGILPSQLPRIQLVSLGLSECHQGIR